MVEGDQGEGEESPEDEGMGNAWKRPLADDFGLTQDFPDEVFHALRDGSERPAEVLASGEDVAEDGGETDEEESGRGAGEEKQQADFEGREVLRFGEIHTGIIPRVPRIRNESNEPLRQDVRSSLKMTDVWAESRNRRRICGGLRRAR